MDLRAVLLIPSGAKTTLADNVFISSAEPVPSGSEPVPSGSEPVPSGAEPVPSGSEPVPSGAEPVPSGVEFITSAIEPVSSSVNAIRAISSQCPLITLLVIEQDCYGCTLNSMVTRLGISSCKVRSLPGECIVYEHQVYCSTVCMYRIFYYMYSRYTI
jgi:hypothetical protein